jgi:hypothetical protein
MKFTAIVRKQESPIALIGKINSKQLSPYIGKLVIITVEVVTPSTKLPPIKPQKPSAPKRKSEGQVSPAPPSG